MNILILCTGNSARSILLESILNRNSEGRVRAYSAGSMPSGRVHPQSLKLLTELGYPTDGLRSQSWDDYATDGAPKMDIVITVCSSASSETCPIWPMTNDHAPVQAHWGIPDPAAAQEHDWSEAFQSAYDALSRKAAALLAQPSEAMTQADLKAALGRIADI